MRHYFHQRGCLVLGKTPSTSILQSRGKVKKSSRFFSPRLTTIIKATCMLHWPKHWFTTGTSYLPGVNQWEFLVISKLFQKKGSIFSYQKFFKTHIFVNIIDINIMGEKIKNLNNLSLFAENPNKTKITSHYLVFNLLKYLISYPII